MENLRDCIRALDDVETELMYLRGITYVFCDSMENGNPDMHIDRTAAARCIYEMVDKISNTVKGMVNDGFQIIRQEKVSEQPESEG